MRISRTAIFSSLHRDLLVQEIALPATGTILSRSGGRPNSPEKRMIHAVGEPMSQGYQRYPATGWVQGSQPTRWAKGPTITMVDN